MKQLQRIALLILSITTLAGGLAACAPLMFGGAAVGVMVAMDRRTSGAQLEDERIELRAGNLIRQTLGERVQVNVTSYNRQVLLTGQAPNAADRQRVQDLVAGVENVRGVVNDLAIRGHSTLSQRSSDALVTTKVRAALVDARDLTATAFKVTTERGTVYLMGRVTQREADRATQITRNVSGVQKVVRIFEIISEEELARIVRVAPPANNPAATSPTP